MGRFSHIFYVSLALGGLCCLPFRAALAEAPDGHPFDRRPITQFHTVYSPVTVTQQGRLHMYFGGWRDPVAEWGFPKQLPRDTIYRLSCSAPDSCAEPVMLFNPQAQGMNHYNDPSVVTLYDTPPAGGGRAFGPRPYYIMYMTGVFDDGDPNAGYHVPNNKIFYATSWGDDGVNWSVPKLVVDGLWLPSATVVPGVGEEVSCVPEDPRPCLVQDQVFLYGNSTHNGRVLRYGMGESGITPGDPEAVRVVDAGGTPLNRWYINVDVQYRPQLGKFQILGEYVTDWAQPLSQIDFLESQDGLTWQLMRENIVPLRPGYKRVLTPAPHPDTHCWVYYGMEPFDNNGVGGQKSNIFLHSWC